MKAFLMYKDRDFDLQRKLSSLDQALIQDLELRTLFDTMAPGDKFLRDVSCKAVLSSLKKPEEILYRQSVFKDCLKNASIVKDIYAIALEAIERERKSYFSIMVRYPGSILSRSLEVMRMFVELLKRLKAIADMHSDKFDSEGFETFFAMIQKELDEEYFGSVQDHLDELQFKDGVLISAELGSGNKGVHYVLRRSRDRKQSWIKRFFAKKEPVYAIHIHPRDDTGARALSDLKDRGLNLVANALAQSVEHILSFFSMLRTELAFYIGCLNLHRQLSKTGEPVTFPLPVAAGERKHSFEGLYDVCLALCMNRRVVGNDVNADGKELVMVTGANQGGKSTFLRSIGIAQLMMQCGMFVPAESFAANVCDGLFTHYKREEDASMNSGKLDEELGRMSEIVDSIRSNSMVLFNESFAATNEREGSEIAGQITFALLEKRIKVFFVTHLYEFAHDFHEKGMGNSLFLRAQRQNDGQRTFRLIEGKPLQTSFGEDLYKVIFERA